MAMHQLKTGANKIHSNTELLIELQEWSDELQALHSCLTWKQEWNWNGRTSQRLMDLVKSVRKPLADELGKLHKTPFLEKRISFFQSNRERQFCLLYSLRQFISLHGVLTFLSLKRTADRNIATCKLAVPVVSKWEIRQEANNGSKANTIQLLDGVIRYKERQIPLHRH